jgi:hypothetical protein
MFMEGEVMMRCRSKVAILAAAIVTSVVVVAAPGFGAAPPVAEWARGTTQAAGDTWFGAVMLDPAGNLFAAGVIRTAEADFGNGVTARDPKPDSWNTLLVKYDASGKAQWAKTVGPGATDSAFNRAATDAAGNMYCVGYIGRGTFDFGNGVTVVGRAAYTTHGYTFDTNADPRKGNIVVVKYDPSGNAQWARTVVANDSSTYIDVAVDSGGGIYCVGNMDKGSFDFGDGVVLSAGPDTEGSGVLVKYDSSGRVLWARTVSTKATPKWHVYFFSVDTDSVGNVYIVGGLGNQAFDFGNGVTVKGDFAEGHAFLAKYDPAGNAQWARLSTFGASEFSSVVVDASGSVYTAGFITSNLPVQFGSGVSLRVPGSGQQMYNMLLVKYDANGGAQWARSVEKASCNSLPNVVRTDAAGNVYVAGIIERDGAFDFGNDVTVKGPYFGYSGNAYGANAVLVKYNEGGTAQWALTVTASSSNTHFFDLTFDPAGPIYAVASMQGGIVAFSPGVNVSSTGLWDNAVLVKYVEGK